MARVVYAPRPFSGRERAIENMQVFLFEVRGTLYGVVVFEMLENLAGLGLGIAELCQRFGNGVVDDLDHAASYEPLVFDNGNVGFDAGGVAVHHERDRSRRRYIGYLGVLDAEPSLQRGRRFTVR